MSTMSLMPMLPSDSPYNRVEGEPSKPSKNQLKVFMACIILMLSGIVIWKSSRDGFGYKVQFQTSILNIVAIPMGWNRRYGSVPVPGARAGKAWSMIKGTSRDARKGQGESRNWFEASGRLEKARAHLEESAESQGDSKRLRRADSRNPGEGERIQKTSASRSAGAHIQKISALQVPSVQHSFVRHAPLLVASSVANEIDMEDVDLSPILSSEEYSEDPFAHFFVHEKMLKDEVRTNSYRRAIEENAHLFEGKVVMDVGCGTGILSMFAARAGAEHVIAVECSAIAEQARRIFADNGYEDRITIIQNSCEDIDELPGGIDEVDIIISEWMGYFLHYETMLSTVIYARDRWLRPGGLMLPDKVTMYITAIEDKNRVDEKSHFWDDVYGFNMSTMKELVFDQPALDRVESSNILTDAASIWHIDLLKFLAPVGDIFSAKFELTAQRDDSCHGLVGYFDCEFSNLPKPIFFSTGPNASPTHWSHTIFHLKAPMKLRRGDKLSGTIKCFPIDDETSDFNVDIELELPAGPVMMQKYRLQE